MLIPVGNSLRGCPRARGTLDLDPAAITLGLACPQREDWCLTRIGVAVRMSAPATLLTTQLAGQLVTLSPPEGQHDNIWLGYLWRPPSQLISTASGACCPQVRVRVTAFFVTRVAATMTAQVPVSAGFG
jgi:hypothetical protein